MYVCMPAYIDSKKSQICNWIPKQNKILLSQKDYQCEVCPTGLRGKKINLKDRKKKLQLNKVNQSDIPNDN